MFPFPLSSDILPIKCVIYFMRKLALIDLAIAEHPLTVSLDPDDLDI